MTNKDDHQASEGAIPVRKFRVPPGLVGFALPVAGVVAFLGLDLGVGLWMLPLTVFIFLLSRGPEPAVQRNFGTGWMLGFLIALPLLILWPAYVSAREGARRSGCQKHLKTLALAARKYSAAHHGQLPNLDSPSVIRAALQGYATSPDIFTCPGTGQPYRGNVHLADNIKTLKDPALTVWFYEDRYPHFEGCNIVYLDGHVRWHRQEQWQELEREMNGQ